MYAIIRTGGKQYRVQPGDCLKVEKLERGLGEAFDIADVLLVDGVIGTPLVTGAKVSVVVTEQGRDSKILIFKKKRRHGYRRTRGHRQSYTKIFVSAITSPNGTAKAETSPQVIDPAKKLERRAKYAAMAKASGEKPEEKVKKKAAAPARKKVTKKKRSGPAKKKAKKKA